MKKRFPIFWGLLLLVLFVNLSLSHSEEAPNQTQPPPSASNPTSKGDTSKVVAMVLGKEILFSQIEPDQRLIETSKQQMSAEQLTEAVREYQREQITTLVFGPLLEKYTSDHNIAPTQEEIDGFIKAMHEGRQNQIKQWKAQEEELLKELNSGSLAEEKKKETSQKLEMIRGFISEYEHIDATGQTNEQIPIGEADIAKQFVRAWKINKSLYEQYGGRVIFQQAGPEPIDAYRTFLEEKEKGGAYKIYDPQLKEVFWEYFVNDQMHTFYSKEDGGKFFDKPWWLTQNVQGVQNTSDKL